MNSQTKQRGKLEVQINAPHQEDGQSIVKRRVIFMQCLTNLTSHYKSSYPSYPHFPNCQKVLLICAMWLAGAKQATARLLKKKRRPGKVVGRLIIAFYKGFSIAQKYLGIILDFLFFCLYFITLEEILKSVLWSDCMLLLKVLTCRHLKLDGAVVSDVSVIKNGLLTTVSVLSKSESLICLSFSLNYGKACLSGTDIRSQSYNAVCCVCIYI